VHHEQGKRRGAVARLMNEVQTQAVHVGQKMREPVEPFFLLPPVELVGPIPHQLLHVVQIDSAAPAGSRNLFWPASSSQPFA
jgi:P pilus assembly chaperone PapD